MKVSDLGLLWEAISKNYKLLEYDELDEQETLLVINYMFRR